MTKSPAPLRRPAVARTLKALDRTIAGFRRKHETVALVPTMGALHAGHLALVRRARRAADRVVVSIFVNPAQFAPSEDFASYPRRLAADVSALAEARADLVWAPDAKVMYPAGFATRVAPEGPALAGLEDKYRPHFFGGVATVVAKLFGQVRPDIAVFGQKDYQQLKVVTRLAADLDLRVKIIGLPTVREKDGLALSSRNLYLSPEERGRAPVLHRVLAECADKIAAGRPIKATLESGAKALARAGFVLDYLEARNAETLAPARSVKDGPIRLLVAARLGTTRLIDNIAV
ncbi:Pantothenate synthetase [Rhodoplanes serenus]|uniref:Pantothenate synthetase n=1 Tax=Rhodoplanes serenus TaxID=200615 RepID=A0A3S4FC10_9BRAD|nr:pantoate--beta-alanine ligase [Rhodoplanes serenus]VCU10725.1 Pantothenate synthetase [Rhodoplanes serenus]